MHTFNIRNTRKIQEQKFIEDILDISKIPTYNFFPKLQKLQQYSNFLSYVQLLPIT